MVWRINKMKCNKCGKIIETNAILSPSLDESKRVICIDCFLKEMNKHKEKRKMKKLWKKFGL